jgi:hypothetical protein
VVSASILEHAAYKLRLARCNHNQLEVDAHLSDQLAQLLGGNKITRGFISLEQQKVPLLLLVRMRLVNPVTAYMKCSRLLVKHFNEVI